MPLNAPHTRREGTRATWRGAGVLLAVLAGFSAAALLLGPDRPHWSASVGFAATVCGVSSLGGWFVGRRQLSSASGGVAAAIGGTALRILLPLAALGWLTTAPPPLKDAGAPGLLVAFYLPLLATTIILTIMEHQRDRGNASPD